MHGEGMGTLGLFSMPCPVYLFYMAVAEFNPNE